MAAAINGARAGRGRWVQALPGRSPHAASHIVETLALPRYTGAGETSIHRAIRDISAQLEARDPTGALRLLVELQSDLQDAVDRHDIVPLMGKWNARYPSQLPVDILESDLVQLHRVLTDLWQRIKDALPVGDEDEEDPEWVHRTRDELAQEIRAQAEESAFESPETMLDRFREMQNSETEFAVHLPRAAQAQLGEPSPVSITVTGMPMVDFIVIALTARYPALASLSWWLRIDGLRPESLFAIVLPASK